MLTLPVQAAQLIAASGDAVTVVRLEAMTEFV
jgi:hypothetical protein